jgi:glycerophosphoryl diester phosphodiesterase
MTISAFVACGEPFRYPEHNLVTRRIARRTGKTIGQLQQSCLWLFLPVSFLCAITSAMEIIAHRGASFDAPENTLSAIRLAWEQGADAVEVDVHLSRDGRVVVIHDANTRKTGGLNRKVCEQTWADLQKLDVGRWKAEQFLGERIPDLDQALSTIPQGKRFFIEVKCDDGFVEAAAETLGKHSDKQIVVIGFSLETMKHVKSAFPQLEVCWIVEFKRRLQTGRWTPSPAAVIEEARAAGLDGLDCGATGPITKEFVESAREAGLRVYVWTVDSVRRARELREAGIDGVTTNRPGWLRDQLRKSG